MSDEDEAVETFYTQERWQNWIDRLEQEDLDLENEDSARLLMNLQEDTAIAVAKVVEAFEEGTIGENRAHSELTKMQEIVLSDAGIEDEETSMLLESVQMSLEVVFYAAQEFIAAGAADGEIEAMVDAAAEAEADEELDVAIGYLVQAGTRVLEGDELDMSILDEMEYGLVAEWLNGLDSLQNALSDPETVEEED